MFVNLTSAFFLSIGLTRALVIFYLMENERMQFFLTRFLVMIGHVGYLIYRCIEVPFTLLYHLLKARRSSKL